MRCRVRPLAVVAALGLAMAVPACGDDGQDLSAVAAAALQGQVGEVRAAVLANDPDDARLELEELRASVERLRGRGEVSKGRAASILAAAEAVESHLGLLVQPTPPRGDVGRGGDVEPEDADDLQREIDESVRKRVEEARKRAEEQIKEAEKRAEEAEKNRGGGGRGRDDD